MDISSIMSTDTSPRPHRWSEHTRPENAQPSSHTQTANASSSQTASPEALLLPNQQNISFVPTIHALFVRAATASGTTYTHTPCTFYRPSECVRQCAACTHRADLRESLYQTSRWTSPQARADALAKLQNPSRTSIHFIVQQRPTTNFDIVETRLLALRESIRQLRLADYWRKVVLEVRKKDHSGFVARQKLLKGWLPIARETRQQILADHSLTFARELARDIRGEELELIELETVVPGVGAELATLGDDIIGGLIKWRIERRVSRMKAIVGHLKKWIRVAESTMKEGLKRTYEVDPEVLFGDNEIREHGVMDEKILELLEDKAKKLRVFGGAVLPDPDSAEGDVADGVAPDFWDTLMNDLFDEPDSQEAEVRTEEMIRGGVAQVLERKGEDEDGRDHSNDEMVDAEEAAGDDDTGSGDRSVEQSAEAASSTAHSHCTAQEVRFATPISSTAASLPRPTWRLRGYPSEEVVERIRSQGADTDDVEDDDNERHYGPWSRPPTMEPLSPVGN